ncbi:glycosyltransferase [Pedobacter sp.]|uniref:glycosyltransferase n=1 Tax=Pedobacter sp. TaxID=1411316 RepID=UPI003BAC73B8
MSPKKLLIIGMVWPEPTSSAAGTRMIQLIDLFLTQGYEITFASAASKSEFSYDFAGKNIKEQPIILNDESFNSFLKDLRPNIILFDRFMIEEQYGWRVQQECPDALRILDTEDLHFLRQARQLGAKKEELVNLYSDVAKREIASILRCDISLIISEMEMNLLLEKFKIEPSLLHYLPFLEDEITQAQVNKWLSFDEREGFAFIGNFLHEPNWNTVQILKTKIWPVLRKKIPGASMNIYGAYPTQKVLDLNNKTEKFLIKGRALDAQQTIAKHRILLAPIQFGAGVKGKFIDAMQVGTPTVTTTVGAEAMSGDLAWNGIIEDDADKFISAAVTLYQDQTLWHTAQQNGMRIINERYAKTAFADVFLTTIDALLLNLKTHRENNFFGQILSHHSLQSTKYMSLWIEEKNKKN